MLGEFINSRLIIGNESLAKTLNKELDKKVGIRNLFICTCKNFQYHQTVSKIPSNNELFRLQKDMLPEKFKD